MNGISFLVFLLFKNWQLSTSCSLFTQKWQSRNSWEYHQLILPLCNKNEKTVCYVRAFYKFPYVLFIESTWRKFGIWMCYYHYEKSFNTTIFNIQLCPNIFIDSIKNQFKCVMQWLSLHDLMFLLISFYRYETFTIRA